MKCPICNVDLVMSERQNVEIDYCPQCRGVWLDRGELDKIIERTNAAVSVPAQTQNQPVAQAQQYPQPQYQQQYGQPVNDNDYYIDKHGKRKHKKSLLGEIFDF
jgi:uncharacterized protein